MREVAVGGTDIPVSFALDHVRLMGNELSWKSHVGCLMDGWDCCVVSKFALPGIERIVLNCFIAPSTDC